ncbi:unnamed protein product [Peronospora destructor]|uniref:Uncharacterized protein n=1 Tax=Peronospora destructor TaxID=86335 RepID=A0AAV0TK02_9STRA|nr:unnamed protein product [Peronospora destructor]
MARTLRTGGLGDSNSGTYVIDTLHLRQAMREGGVNASEESLSIPHALEDTGKKSRWKSKKSRLIKFIDSIMHGLFHKNLPDGRCSIRECSGDQFWNINGPIVYLCWARLTKSILPELHEDRFVSVPFLRTEDDLTFNYEEDNPKLALRIHQDLLWSHLHFFRVQFEALAPELPVSNEEDQTSKIKLGVQTAQTTWTQYYRRLSQIFRQILVHPQLTRLEKAIQSWQELTAYSTNDTRLEGKIQDHSMLSLRERFHRQQLQQSWMSVMPNVDAYCRRIEVMRRDPVDVAAARAVLSEMGLASHASLESISPSGRYDGVDKSIVMGLHPDVTWAEKSQASISINPEDSKMPSSMYSSRRDALWFIECFFLPPLANNSFLVAGDALVNNEKIASRIASVRVDISDEGSVPGLAVAWGKPLGLPLAEKENGIESSTYLYTFGHGKCGRLGHGTEEACTEPRVVGYFASLIAAEGVAVGGILDVSCGREHTMVVIASGDLYGLGSGEAGRLGTCETGSSLYPSRVMDLQNIAAVACGREHTLALTRKGRVFSLGVGQGGRLGNGSETDKEQPFAVCGMEGYRITAIDAGECHSCALSNEGDVFTWGFSSSGSLGHGNRDNCLKPRKLEGLWTRSPNVERDEDNLTRAESVVTSIACGSYHTLAATSDGELYGWDDATAGQLGDEYVSMPDMVVLIPKKISVPTVSGIRCIACGTFTSAVCTNEGQLFLWGSPAAGNGDALELEDARVKNIGALSEFKFSQIACGENHAVAITQKLAYY